MSILVNLLPDLRQAKLREHRRRQMVSGVAVAVWIVCGGVVVLLGAYAAGQKVIISNDTHSINDEKQQLQQVPGLLDAFTAEQHLASLSGLYRRRVYLTKFFGAYTASDPNGVVLASLSVDNQNTLTVQGTAPNYAAVAKLARALAAGNVTLGTGAAAGNSPYFSSVTIVNVNAVNSGSIAFSLTATLSSEVISGGQ